MKALYFNHFGNSNVLKYGNIADPIINANSLLIQTTFIGLNYADIYRRNGNYHIEKHEPYINGYEGIGNVVKIGENIKNYHIGDRILFVDVPFSNAELVAVPAENAINVPKFITDKIAISLGLQGLTADFLAHDLAANHIDEHVFIHGLSGGVSQILTQLLVADGIKVSGTVSNDNKIQISLDNGSEHVYKRDEISNGKLFNTFDTVYDGVGKTLPQSLELLKHRGKVIFYGMAGGLPSPIDPVNLMSESKSILTGDLWDYLTDHKSRQLRFNRLLKYINRHQLKINSPEVIPLSNGQIAHELMESGHSAGKILLQP